MIIVQLVSSGLLIACVLITVLSLYFLYRIDKVYKFRCQIIDLVCKAQIKSVHNGEYDIEKYDFIYHKHSYGKMLYSFKPLKLEKWFTKEEIELLNKYK